MEIKKLLEARRKLEESFGNKVLNSIVGGEIKEIAEDSKNITILFELKFKDGSAFAYYFTIEKCKLRVNDINGMVL